jgi:tetratricopeptide (TPR) repeat protein
MAAFALQLAAAPPTFAHDIAPVVWKNCAPCHRPGEAGPFSLLSYRDVKSHARQIADVTRRRYMPPWLPEAGHGDFAGDLRLSDREVQLFADWAVAGAPEGNASETPALPKFTEGWQLGPPDVILTPSHAYTLPAAGPDVYWNFILPAELSTSRYVRAVEIRPGGKRVVHHANLYVDRARSARRLEVAEDQGFPGMDVPIDRPASEPDDGHFLFWKPGGTPYIEPDGYSWRLDPGNDLVLNAHLQPTGKPELVKPSIGLYFTKEPPFFFPMLVELEHDGALDIPAGARDFVVSDDFRLPMDVKVLAVYPHAHYLGHVLEGYATLPSGERQWLIRIPNWDPNWQAAYHFKEPVDLPEGTVISMRYHYDNSAENPRNPNSPPKRVEAGNQATDEMGHLWLQVLPEAAFRPGPDLRIGGAPRGDRRMELEEALMRHRLEKYPDDFDARLQLGALRLARLDPNEALAMLRDAVRLQPDHAEARNLLGSALVAVGRNTEAVEQFRAALRARPDYGNAHYNLARALVRAANYDEAAANYLEALKLFPRDAQVRDELGEVYLRQHKFGDAVAQFDEALAIDPKNQRAREDRDAAAKEASPEALASIKKPEQTDDVQWWRPQKPLPAFSLRGLDGKTWTTADFAGKTVLISLWATWCGPCRAEHHELQKLYDELKDRKDVAVLSFNVDVGDDVAKIAPYMAENHYTFPVVLANDFVDAYLPEVFIPQTWFLDGHGSLQWMRQGFATDENWQQTMMTMLEKVLKGSK